jgi:hypothetical protein
VPTKRRDYLQEYKARFSRSRSVQTRKPAPKHFVPADHRQKRTLCTGRPFTVLVACADRPPCGSRSREITVASAQPPDARPPRVNQSRCSRHTLHVGSALLITRRKLVNLYLARICSRGRVLFFHRALQLQQHECSLVIRVESSDFSIRIRWIFRKLSGLDLRVPEAASIVDTGCCKKSRHKNAI